MFREIEEKDFERLSQEIALDPAHNQQPGFSPELFQDAMSKNVVFEDENGEPIFYANFTKEVRVRIQFVDGADKEKVRATFSQYIPQFAASFKAAGCKAFLFGSVSAPLIWFLRQFGFRKAASEYRKEF